MSTNESEKSVARRSGRARLTTPLVAALLIVGGGLLWWRLSDESNREPTAAEQASAARVAAGLRDSQRDRWRREAQENGGWDDWKQRLEPLRAGVRRLPVPPLDKPVVVAGLDGMVFSPADLDYLLAGELRNAVPARDPLAAMIDFRRQLKSHKIDLLIVLVPVKSQIYPERISAATAAAVAGLVKPVSARTARKIAAPISAPGRHPIVVPQSRRFMMQLATAGIDCVDLLPAFLEARDKQKEPFYLKQDSGWSNPAARLAARLIGDRVKAYAWYKRATRNAVKFATRPTAVPPPTDALPPQTSPGTVLPGVEVQQVMHDGKPYADDTQSPIIVLGDHFAALYSEQQAGLAAHLAKEIGIAVKQVTSDESGAKAARDFVAEGATTLKNRRLVIWTVAERSLHQANADWSPIAFPK